MKLRKRALGLSLGFVLGITVLFGTWWLLAWDSTGTTISKLGKFFVGYSFSWEGGIIGLLWGIVYGFVIGVLIGWFYYFFSKMIYKEKLS